MKYKTPAQLAKMSLEQLESIHGLEGAYYMLKYNDLVHNLIQRKRSEMGLGSDPNTNSLIRGLHNFNLQKLLKNT